jgi:deoxyadenosine/deoxycytidine kinase
VVDEIADSSSFEWKHPEQPTQQLEPERKEVSSLRNIVVEVEGNIASGKSTLLRHLHSVLHASKPNSCSVFGEIINNDFLGAFYSDAKKYAFAFQMYMLTTRLHQMSEAARQAKDEGKVVFLDRGAVGDSLFAILNHKLGNMDDQSMNVYKSVCTQRLPASLSESVDILLYLDTSPAECLRRVMTVRKNDAETGIPLSYLESVDEVHFELLLHWLGNRQSEYHDMNIGPCPRAVFLRWERFGTCEDVISVLEQVQAGLRKLPTVCFESRDQDLDILYESKIETENDVQVAYAFLEKTNLIKFDKTHPVYINWQLAHGNAFRRVIFYFLSEGADLNIVTKG